MLLHSSLAAAALSLPLAAAPLNNDIVIDLGRGPVTVNVPDSYDGSEPAPLVLLLHGYTSSGAETEATVGLKALVDTYGFFYAHPDGTFDAFGYRFWNATNACCNFLGSGVDDSGYLRAFIEEVGNQLNMDDRRVYIVGHSNGGFMAYRMACDHPQRIAAVVSYAGATYKNPGSCNPQNKVNTLQIHGTQDGTILYGGGDILGVVYPGDRETAEIWATYNGCTLQADTSSPKINIDASVPGAETAIRKYEDQCDLGGSAELWRVQGGGHVPVPTSVFAPLVLEWLYEHATPGLTANRYCSPNEPNSTGVPGVLNADGSDVLADNDFALTAVQLPFNQFGYFLASLTPGFVPNPGGSPGNLCVAGEIARYAKDVQNSGIFGTFSLGIDLTNIPLSPPVGVQTGDTWYFQAWHRDGSESNFTDALSVLFR